MSQQPIVLFDSGIGGTSILKEVANYLPDEDLIYLADSHNAPYGNKTPQEIIKLSVKNTELALSLQAKLIIVACNTATTNAISYLRKSYPLPFIGIEPAIKPAALKSKAKKIGILATKGTLSSDLFKKTSFSFTKGIDVVEIEGYGIVEAVENGTTSDPQFLQLLEKQIQPFIQENIDYLVLGCTHFPYIIPQLKLFLPAHVNIIDSGQAVAKQTHTILKKHGIEHLPQKKRSVKIISNASNLAPLKQLVQEIAHHEVIKEEF